MQCASAVIHPPHPRDTSQWCVAVARHLPSPIFSVVEIIKQALPTNLKPAGYRTSSRDSVRLFEGQGKKSVKGLLLTCDGFEDAVVAAIRHEQEFLGRKLSTKIRSSEEVNMSIRVALKDVCSEEIELGSVAVLDNGVSQKNGVANCISGVFPV